MLTDTAPEAEKAQIELIRQASEERRVAAALSLTATALDLSRRAVAEANPQLSPSEAALLWAELHYGKKLADELRDYLERRTHAIVRHD